MTALSAPSWSGASASVPDERPTRDTRAVRACTVIALLSTTVLARFGANVGGESLPISLAALYVLVAALALSQRARIEGTTMMLYGSVLVFAYVSWFMNTSYGAVNRASPSSLLFLIALYLPFVITMRASLGDASEWRWTVRAFGNIALLCALAGIAQFFAQFIIDTPWLFDFSHYLPEAVRNLGTYNTQIPVGNLYKSNGFFLREPSAFSFLMALAAIVELNTEKRWHRVALFVFALLLTYSGTGLLALILGLMFPLGLKTLGRLVAIAVGGMLLIALLGDALNLSFTVNRIQEFGSEHSSAYIRYVAPLHVIASSIDSTPWTALFGHGPGSIQRTSQAFQAFDPTWAKLIFEYGLLGCAALVSLVVHALVRSGVPAQMRAVLFFCWLIMGGHLLSPDNVSTLYVLACMWRRDVASVEAAARPSENAALPHARSV
ncbi:MAG: hypothetical protein GX535_01400 [Xanthomonadaceae bacterium]|nr:hypothetical protein [Xanthomonadaceae bacterium]